MIAITSRIGERLMSQFKYILPLLLVILVVAANSFADTFSEGGDAYKNGDYVTALAKFREVAAKGDHRAMYALGSMYAGGNGVKRDYQQAYKWFASAAKYGRLDAQYKLGLMYELGVGVKQDYRRAARYYQDVARKGYAHGQFRFGQLYLQGKGVQQDPVKACAWMSTARQNFLNTMPKTDSGGVNNDQALPVDGFQSSDIFATIHLNLIDTELQSLQSRMTPAQADEARQLAQEYLTYH